MLFFIILPLLALLPTSFVGAALTSPSFISFISVQKQHIHYLSVALGGSSTSQGSINRHHNHAHRSMSHSVSPSPSASAVSPGSLSSPTPSTSSRHHRHGHISRGHAVSTSPSTTTSGCATCSDPFSSAPFGTPCACVLPMKVRLRLGVSIFSIFPVVSELEIEVAAGTFLKQSQVAITGAVADVQNQEKAVVDFHLLPLGGTFDNTTISLNYQRFLKKEVHLNSSLFGDYDVLLIRYPGFPDLPSSDSLPGAGPKGSTKNPQYPIPADVAGKNEKMNHGIILIIALSAFVLLVVCFGAVVILVHNRKVGISFDVGSLVFTKPMEKRFGKESMQSSSPPTNSAPVSFVSAMPASILSVKTFSLVELEKATEKFSPEKILGEGGFGRVYHGIMENGNEVAVKLLKRDSQNGDSEFIAEIEMLSRLHHCNLVKLIGICIEECSRCLVYELVPNGSIESHIHGADRSKGPLDWAARLKIALGAARGLAYLHEDSNPRVIHRDFKSSNVLLEDDFTPKVSDFGLAREATEGSDLISTRVMGTFGYVAPEYAMTGHLLVKSDVYSYGVVLLELLTGRKPVDMSQIPGQENLVVWARPLLSDQQGLEQLADPALAGTYDPDDMARVAAIASMCVHPEVTQRPFMGEVVQALKLICNDTDSICGDGYSPEQPSDRYLDINEDSAISEGSWWNPECVSSRQQFVTMELRNSPGLGWDSVEGGVGLPTRHENRSGPLKIIRGNRDYYRLRESMSEHMGLQVKRDLKDVCGYESFF